MSKNKKSVAMPAQMKFRTDKFFLFVYVLVAIMFAMQFVIIFGIDLI